MSHAARKNLRLEDCGLYAVASPKFLAARLSTKHQQFSAADLQALANDSGNFKLWDKRNKDGSKRRIEEPKPLLQRIHKRVHILLSRIEVPSYLHSAVKGRSYLSNAADHDPGVRTIKIDVKKFFPSVPRAKVFGFFRDTLKCRPDVAGLMAHLLTFQGHLPTGSCASPIIAYYAFKQMFDEIAALSARYGLHMTCYVDDMTLSGENATGQVLAEIRAIVARYGLKSHKPYRFGPNQPRVVTGVCLTTRGLRVPNKLHLKIAQGFDAMKQARTVKDREKIRRSLMGRLHAAGQIDAKFKARAITLKNATD
jgi:hypothetical protein